MHWLIRRSVENFLRDIYGDAFWLALWRSADDCDDIFLPNDRDGHSIVVDAAQRLNKPVHDLLEDLGAWIARQERTRRLLRFSGRNFGEFLENLELLPDRMRMVVPDLVMPPAQIVDMRNDYLQISLNEDRPEWTFVIAGLVRAMADDYGVLCLILAEGTTISVQACDGSFHEKRSFQLAWNETFYAERRI